MMEPRAGLVGPSGAASLWPGSGFLYAPLGRYLGLAAPAPAGKTMSAGA